MVTIVSKNIDVFLISENWLENIRKYQFHIEAYVTTFRLDRDINGGGFLLYITEDIPSSLFNSNISFCS